MSIHHILRSASGAVGDALDPAQYWRLYITAASDWVKILEIGWRDAIGGTDLTGSGTAITNSTSGFGSAAEAYDDDNNTYWSTYSDNGAGYWIGYNFGVDVTPKELYVVVPGSNRPSEVAVEYSNDGNTWTRSPILLSDWSTGFTQIGSNNQYEKTFPLQ